MPRICIEDKCSYNVFSKDRCYNHYRNWYAANYVKKQKNRRAKIKYRTKKNSDKKKMELEAMKKKWNQNLVHGFDRDYCLCECTGQRIYEFDTYHIAHIISKGSNGLMRCDTENMVIVIRDVHNAMDGTNSKGQTIREFSPNFYRFLEERKMQLKNKYHSKK